MDRMDKVNQQVKRELSDVLRREMSDPRLQSVAITYVKVSRDLRHARVFYSVLINSHTVDNVQKALESASKAIRRNLGHRLTMRYTPELFFQHDESIEFSAKIEETLEELKHEQDETSQDN